MRTQVIIVGCLCSACYTTTPVAEEQVFQPLCGSEAIESCTASSEPSRVGSLLAIAVASEDAIDARVAPGADLDCRDSDELDDATCGHEDYVDYQGGVGVDNQFGPAHVLLFPHHPSWASEWALRVMEATDDCIGVELGEERSWGGRASSRGGLVDVEARLDDTTLLIPITIVHDGREVRDETIQLTLRDVAVRVPLEPDAETFTALMVGGFDVDELVAAYTGADPAFLPERLVHSIASAQADLSPDEDGVCQRVSAAFELRGRWSP